MKELHLVFREYTRLERKRTGDGLTPAEYQRYRALARQLATRFSKGPPKGGAERRESVRVPTRLKVSFASQDDGVFADNRAAAQGGEADRAVLSRTSVAVAYPN